MSIHDNDKLIRDFYSLLDKGDMKAALDVIASDAEFKVLGMEMVAHGHDEIMKSFESWGKAFPDMKCEILNLIASEDSVAVEEINRGTHSGDLESTMGVLPATGRKIEVPAVSTFRISNGKIAGWNIYWLNDVMLNQMGYGPQKKAA